MFTKIGIFLISTQVHSAHVNGICIHILDMLFSVQRVQDCNDEEVAIPGC